MNEEAALRERIEELEHILSEITTPPTAMAVLPDGRILTRKQARLYHVLHGRMGKTFTRAALIHALYWDKPDAPCENCIDFYVCHVRKALHKSGAPLAIETISGVGFRMVAA